MKINIKALEKLAENRKWGTPELANRLNIDYSYLFRVLNGDKNGGAKLFAGIYQLCKEEELELEDYIFLDKPLSANNEKSKVS